MKNCTGPHGILLLLLLCILLVSFANVNGDRVWVEVRGTEERSLKYLIDLLRRSSTGGRLLEAAAQKAHRKGQVLHDVIQAGDFSLTDTTLVRRFSVKRPDKVVFETRSKVFLDRDLTVVDALLDMAHELAHYAYRTPFNPYRRDFTLKGFLKSTVEGRGGEVEAYLVECQVLQELFPDDEIEGKSNCSRIRDPVSGRLSKILGIREFYRMGKHLKGFIRDLRPYRVQGEDFPHLSGHQALFISSTYGLPYPLAAFKEYRLIMDKVCRNDLKRLLLFKKLFREELGDRNGPYHQLEISYRMRCKDMGGAMGGA